MPLMSQCMWFRAVLLCAAYVAVHAVKSVLGATGNAVLGAADNTVNKINCVSVLGAVDNTVHVIRAYCILLHTLHINPVRPRYFLLR